MSREPLSKRTVVAVGGMAGILLAASHVAARGGGITFEDSIIALLLLAFLIQPFATLGHELGHAVAALILGGRPSLIVVGRGPFLRVRAEPTLVLFSVLPTRGVPFAGVCRYDPKGLPWRSIALIALAGPLATLLELLAVVALGFAMWDTGSLGRVLIVWTGLWLAASILVNLWPHQRVMRPGSDQALRRDGDLARYAYCRHRAAAAGV